MELNIPDSAVNLAIVGPDPTLLPDVNRVLAQGLFRPSLYDVQNVEASLAGVMDREFHADGIAGELTVTNGALDALERIVLAHLKPGDTMIVEDPSWSSSLGLLQVLGITTVGAAIDDEGITEEGLRTALATRHASALLVTPRAQNPFGSAMTPARAAALQGVLDEHPHLVVIEDDHAGLIGDAPAVTLTRGRSQYAVIRSMNKALGPDLRVAAMMSDPGTADAVRRRMLLGPGWVSHLLQRTVATMLQDADTLASVAHAREQYTLRREAFLAALARRGVEAHGRSGLNVLIPVPDETAVVSHLLVHGWAVRGGASFRLNAEPFIRVCTAALDPEQGEALAATLATILTPGPRVAAP
jgi:DNA-binding transcriptional MocR family regulator